MSQVDRLVSMLEAEREECARLEAVIERVGNVLAAHGCDCECAPTCGTEHDDDCERCLGCRVEAALRGAR
jgi:hypothetical protein